MTRFWDGRTNGWTDGWSDCTPRPAFAFSDAGKNIWHFSDFSCQIAHKLWRFINHDIQKIQADQKVILDNKQEIHVIEWYLILSFL